MEQLLAPTTAPVFAISEREWEIFFGGEKPDNGLIYQGPREKLGEFLAEVGAEVLVSCWSTLALAPAWLLSADCPLRYVCHLTGSVRGLLPRAFLEQGGRVTNWGCLAAPQVAEHALLLALAALRRLPEWPGRHWETKFRTSSLFGRRVGLHGFGQVARCLRELLRPFQVEVFAFSHGVPPECMTDLDVSPCASLDELFARSEVLMECEALTPTTKGTVTAEILAGLPDGAVFVNVGRGALIDEAALIREAEAGRLSIALDVVTYEPLDPASPLATLPNVIYSPHIAGPTGDQYRRCGELALANLARYRAGAPLEAEVTLEIYDRAT